MVAGPFMQEHVWTVPKHMWAQKKIYIYGCRLLSRRLHPPRTSDHASRYWVVVVLVAWSIACLERYLVLNCSFPPCLERCWSCAHCLEVLLEHRHFRKLEVQSSNVSFATLQWKQTFELWALSFETAFENVTPSGIGCNICPGEHDLCCAGLLYIRMTVT